VGHEIANLLKEAVRVTMASTNNITTVDEQSAASKKPYGPLDANALNLPNCITVSRLVLAFVLFAMISYGGLWFASAIVFAVAAATDAVDGYLARRYGMVTTLGRILDPFVDKIIVCGAFIFLLAASEPSGGVQSGVGPWMTLIVIGREMFITGLRSILEQQGKDFSASLSGKIKMVVQCFAVEASLLSMSPALNSAWFNGLRDVLLWLAVLFTLGSGVLYIRRAARLLRSP
jgi:CDP-diacylglycerol---glycerol-3-phosphate 3-phosphatidyltransferase